VRGERAQFRASLPQERYGLISPIEGQQGAALRAQRPTAQPARCSKLLEGALSHIWTAHCEFQLCFEQPGLDRTRVRVGWAQQVGDVDPKAACQDLCGAQGQSGVAVFELADEAFREVVASESVLAQASRMT
jgi:hypothetical protein